MAKKATTGLLAKVAELPVSAGRRVNKTWLERLAEVDPMLLDEVHMLVDQFHAGDREVRCKLATELDLAKFIQRHVAAAGVPISVQTIRRHVAEKRNG